MIRIVVTKKNDQYLSFRCSGHAEYADSGKDIVCSAVSILVINTINAIEQFTDTAFTLNAEEAIEWHFPEGIDHDTQLLMDALLLGLTEIKKQYGKKYLNLLFEEV